MRSPTHAMHITGGSAMNVLTELLAGVVHLVGWLV
ncbi:hypothetical protein QO019_001250 [Streptomyces thermodiastaticus]|uniref:Uncharacterized protein n=1 Tax=Streptomyces thermodiastaticus TaxID=44061 RepID=A0ABU0KCR3_9ACTN|nr:hypothetical protein [Streptomyces thermodiastaticus]